jgi:hypothetical protein
METASGHAGRPESGRPDRSSSGSGRRRTEPGFPCQPDRCLNSDNRVHAARASPLAASAQMSSITVVATADRGHDHLPDDCRAACGRPR